LPDDINSFKQKKEVFFDNFQVAGHMLLTGISASTPIQTGHTSPNVCYYVPVQLLVHFPVPAAIDFLNFCPSAHAIDVFQLLCQLFRHK